MLAERRERVLFALVRRDLINFSLGRPKEPVQLVDLVPDFKPETPVSTARPRRMTRKRRQEIANRIRAFFATTADPVRKL